jgi:hypothetical protein
MIVKHYYQQDFPHFMFRYSSCSSSWWFGGESAGGSGAGTGEEVADSGGQRVEAEGWDVEEALGNSRELFTQEFQLQLLSQERGGEVGGCGHQENHGFQPLVGW